jgi:hypothetical protein
VLSTARKPFQDSPTHAGNPTAVIALLRIYNYTDEPAYRDRAEQTLELLAGAAGQYGLFAATYGIAAVRFSTPHTHIVVVGEDETAAQLYAESVASGNQSGSVLKLTFSQVARQNLPPTLAATIPQLPAISQGKTVAVVCSGATCQPPVYSAEALKDILLTRQSAA